MNFFKKNISRNFTSKNYRKLRCYLFLLGLIFFAASCNSTKNETPEIEPDKFSFSPHKIWAHRVNTFEEVEKKHHLFEGMEVDLIYSKSINEFYIAHDEIDTINGIMLDEWIERIPNPEKNWYWLDLKNLDKENAVEIAQLLVSKLNKYGILHKVICENRNVKALALLKSAGLAVSYWVSSDVTFRKIFGNAIWKKIVKKKIAYLKPDALSSFYWMHPLLNTAFPNENILYWHTSDDEIPASVDFTRELCNISNVKVVLVDYDFPIEY